MTLAPPDASHGASHDAPPQEPTALLVHQGVLFYSTGGLPKHLPHSPVVDLIQGLWEKSLREPLSPLKLLRERIWTNYSPTLICRETVRVAAKRISFCDGQENPQAFKWNEIWAATGDRVRVAAPQSPEAQCPNLDPISFLSHQGAMAYALRLKAQAETQSGRTAIACILVGDNGKLLAQSTHVGLGNRALHAEAQALRNYFLENPRAEGLPRGVRAFVTLKPCKMCAAQLVHCCLEPDSLQVSYAEFDPGPMAQRTVLDAKKLNFLAN